MPRGGERTIDGSQLSPSTRWGPGTELRLLGLVQGLFLLSLCWPLILVWGSLPFDLSTLLL